MSLGAGQPHSIRQSHLPRLSFEGFALWAGPNNLHTEAAATSPKDAGGGDQVFEPLLFDQPGNGEDFRFTAFERRPRMELELGSVESVINAADLSTGQAAKLFQQITAVVFRTRHHRPCFLELAA